MSVLIPHQYKHAINKNRLLAYRLPVKIHFEKNADDTPKAILMRITPHNS
jgi:hypothetical protein